MATMLKGLGVMCEIKSNLMTFALSSAVVPKMIDPFAMLQLFNGGCSCCRAKWIFKKQAEYHCAALALNRVD
jgi:hypothetical protein